MSIADWADLMTQTITITQFGSTDKYGKPTHVSPVNYSCRIVQSSKLVLNSNPNSHTVGQEILATGVIWVQTTDVIDYNDELTLPDGKTPEILSVQQFPDEGGDHHVKIMYRGAHG